MINRSDEDIEANRLEHIASLETEDEDGNVSPGFTAESFVPTTFGYHEGMHTASLAMDFVGSNLVEHPSVMLDSVAYRLATQAHTALFNLYQHMGELHLKEE